MLDLNPIYTLKIISKKTLDSLVFVRYNMYKAKETS